MAESTAVSGTVTSTTTYVIPNGELLSFMRDGAYYQVHKDSMGSIRMLSDSLGNVVFRAEYDAWGNCLSVNDDLPGRNSYLFVGVYGVRWDPDSQFYYMRNRWYDAAMQRFVTRDPVRSSNRYLYAASNPTTLADPLGLCPIYLASWLVDGSFGWGMHSEVWLKDKSSRFWPFGWGQAFGEDKKTLKPCKGNKGYGFLTASFPEGPVKGPVSAPGFQLEYMGDDGRDCFSTVMIIKSLSDMFSGRLIYSPTPGWDWLNDGTYNSNSGARTIMYVLTGQDILWPLPNQQHVHIIPNGVQQPGPFLPGTGYPGAPGR